MRKRSQRTVQRISKVTFSSVVYREAETPGIAAVESIDLDASPAASPGSFELKVDGANIWFQTTLPPRDASESEITAISVKGKNITRAEQENWQSMIAEKRKDSQYVLPCLLPPSSS